ncbi:hypothetical protein BC962_2684 [Gillisia mitskevichiae]|uniref:Uncharacterized protein n=1 Tax=Gillisia mitskevichiae TaxID=270921 RepID=A0A495P714_9FLAO|nr:hypothetical protein BC962_2684 [Gillisia mitskevichiae]
MSLGVLMKSYIFLKAHCYNLIDIDMYYRIFGFKKILIIYF